MSANRAAGRNVHIYDTRNPATELGGLVLNNGVTNANFYSMIEIFCIFDQPYFLRFGDANGDVVQRDGQQLHQGNYYILTNGSITVNNEAWLAAHIFPIAYESHWLSNNYGLWITIPPANGGLINSVQNGMLLRDDIHTHFDNYSFTINPDDGFKIVCFRPDRKGIAGKHLDRQLLDDPRRPATPLLRWHFRQAVLANMRGAGEPIFELDFPPGSDMLGEIGSGPMAAERMEFELFSRLRAG